MRKSATATGSLLALAVAMLSACGTQSAAAPSVVSYHAAYPSFGSQQEIVKAADVIVRGTAIGPSRVTELKPTISTSGDPVVNPQAGLSEEDVAKTATSPGPVVTITTVRVDEVIKGLVKPGDRIEVSQLGGEYRGVRYVEQTTTLLSAGSTTGYVLFIAAYPTPGTPYDLLNPEQAMYTVSSDGSLAATGRGNPIRIAKLDGLKAAARG